MAPEALYQVVVLGGGRAAHEAALTEFILERAGEIGDDLRTSLRVMGPSDIGSLVSTAPSVGIYLGGDCVTDLASVELLSEASIPILPVVDDLEDYHNKVPPLLHPINGMTIDWTTPDFTGPVNVLLENLSLLRRTRRLFLSYLRKESTPIAHQLRVAFDDLGYDPFLDTSSVPKGDDFQAILWHRLLDSDVMVVLDTENFLTSRWTKEELAQASAMGVGMLRIVWPGVARAGPAELAVHLYMDAADFAGDRLNDDAVTRIVTTTEALRGRCIAARHTNLVVEFCEEAERVGAEATVQPERFVLTQLRDGRRIAAIPAVGVPDARLYHEAANRFSAAGKRVDEAILIYDHRGMLPAWTEFLDWLDNHLPVKGLRVTETAARLGGLR